MVITGTRARMAGPHRDAGPHQRSRLRRPARFPGLIDALSRFPKPLICAVNGLGLGLGATILGFADLAFMSSTAKLAPVHQPRCGAGAASSYLLPRLIGRQNAAWLLMSSEWVEAAEALRMGLVWRVCEPADLIAETRGHAVLPPNRFRAWIAVKESMAEPTRAGIAARAREDAFAAMMGAAANAEALAEFQRGRG